MTLSAAKTSAANSKAIVLAQEDCTAVLRRAGEGTAQVRTVDGSIVLSVGSAKDIAFDRQGDDKNPTSIFSLVSVTVCVCLEYTYTQMHTHSVLPASVKVRNYVGLVQPSPFVNILRLNRLVSTNQTLKHSGPRLT